MAAKLKLEIEALSVESFETAKEGAHGRGTVRAREEGCTCARTCACPSAPIYCAPIAYTFYSCDFTFNDSCTVEPTNQTCATCEFACPTPASPC